MSNEAALLESQRGDTHSQNIMKMVLSKPPWIVNDAALPCHKAPVNGQVQILVLARQHTVLLYNAHYPKLAGHFWVTRIYNTLRQHFCWSHMPQEVHAYFSQYELCR